MLGGEVEIIRSQIIRKSKKLKPKGNNYMMSAILQGKSKVLKDRGEILKD